MMNIAGVNIPNSIIECEYRIGILEKTLDRIAPLLPPGAITPQMIEQIRNDVFATLQEKYPDAGLVRTPPKT